MSDRLRQAADDALSCLLTLSRDGVRPAEAQQRLQTVQARHPELGLQLVWEEEPFDGALHYDALLRGEDGTTVSVSAGRDGALPWPLRGVRRWSDADLAQVNGKILKIQDAVSFLDLIWNQAPILARLVDVCLIREELELRPVELSDAEVQRELDRMRRAHQLHDAAATHRWMHERGLTHEALERLILEKLTGERLRARVAEGRVERYFEEHRADFDTAAVVRLELADEASARRVHRQLVAGELELFAAAQAQFLAAPNLPRAPLFATLRRGDGERLRAIFAAAPGTLMEPERSDDKFVITRLLALSPARLDETTRAEIEQRLFDAWLAERRGKADVTWFWGTADRASLAA